MICAMQMNTGGRFYQPELDGLRFIAFLLVFIHNSPINSSNPLLNALHEYGWIGVDLFFCLSAFLITKLLVMEHRQTGEISVRNFYFRRALRILPLYFIYTSIAVYYIIQTIGWDATLLKHLLGITTFTYDFVYLCLTYKTFSVFFHLWTISYEEQFYAVIPWIARKLIYVSEKTVWGWLIVACIIGSLIRASFIYLKVPHPAIYMLPFTHFEAILGGLAAGFGLFDKFLSGTKGWILLAPGLIGNAIIFLLPNTYEIGWNLMITYPMVGIGMLFIVLAMSKRDGNVFAKALGFKPLVYLGKISFGLYLFHLICISMVFQFPGGRLENHAIHNLLAPIISLILTIVLSALSYQWIEIPFLKLRERFGSIKSRPV